MPTTYLLTSFYWDNFIHFGMGPKAGEDGQLAIAFPIGDARLPGIAAEDIGRCAYGIFKEGTDHVGKTIGISGEHLGGQEMADAFTAAIGKPVGYYAVEPEAYRGFGFPGAEDLGNMFQYKRDFEGQFRETRSIEGSRRLNPQLQTLSQWLEANKDSIALD